MTNDPPTLYLAGPINAKADYGKGWREWIKSEKSDEFAFNDPIDMTDPTEVHNDDGSIDDETVAPLVEADKALIDGADVLFVRWEQDTRTVGTPMEILYAHERQMPVVVWHVDTEAAKLSPWLRYHADEMRRSLDACLETAREVGNEQYVQQSQIHE